MGMAVSYILERKETLLKHNYMNNEEKAQQICEKNKRYHVECSSLECYLSAMDMAQWKDEQFKEQKKLTWKEVKYIIELYGDIETDNFMGSDEYYQAIADKANVVLFGLQGKLND
jgi:hypothetical protein